MIIRENKIIDQFPTPKNGDRIVCLPGATKRKEYGTKNGAGDGGMLRRLRLELHCLLSGL